MSEKRFTLSKHSTSSKLSDFCDGNGRMLNSEVVDKLNEQQAKIEKLEKQLEQIPKSIREVWLE